MGGGLKKSASTFLGKGSQKRGGEAATTEGRVPPSISFSFCD